ncbi:Circadian phase modifier [hydrothermal vent metagenome]|uniref:Circadian phase modifier n=1 Tax=hydrothermal vent metagenome TaxID=652676 RepID=A0A3B1CB04_9ZZZZ
MTNQELIKIIGLLYEKKIKPQEALNMLKRFPTENLGFANIDHHRGLRQGFAEVVYCEGKSVQDVAAIAERLIAGKGPLLLTRANQKIFTRIKSLSDKAVFHKRSGTIVIEPEKRNKTGYVLVVSAGTSDIPVAEEAAVTASVMGSKVQTLYDVGVAGIHRLLKYIDMLMKARVIVVVAGMDGALASVVGGLVDRPVVAVPTSVGYGAAFGGVAALLAMLNSCSAGVAVMNIDNGYGAGALAHKINVVPKNSDK